MVERSKYIGIEVLVVDGDETVRTGLKNLLSESGFIVTATDDVEASIDLIRTKYFAVVVCDLDTPESEAGLRVVEASVRHSPATTCIMLSPRKAYDVAVTAFRGGATDIVVKSPEQVGYLRDRVVEHAAEWKRQRDRDELLLLMADVHDGFMSRMREMYRAVVDFQDKLQGRDVMATFQLPECRVLVVDDSPDVYEAVGDAFKDRDDGWVFTQVQSGGEALDITGREKYHVALIKDWLPDLPGSMVATSIKSQSAETICLIYNPPGQDNARVDVRDGESVVNLITEFREATQIAGRLDELRDAFRAKARERRYLQSFRTSQYDFIKKYAEVRKELEKAKGDMKDRVES